VNVDAAEIPKEESLDYIVSTPSEMRIVHDDDLIVFCIDISGSMGISYEVEGSFSLKGEEKVKKLQSLKTEDSDQRLPREKRNVTYVTRLQCVQAAIGAELDRMSKESPNKKVAIVTFNNEVTICGSQMTDTVVTGDKLNNQEELMDIGRRINITRPIKDSKEDLISKLFSLEEIGPTGLGPALAISIGMCENHAGSKIVICTDGLANMGIGSMEGFETNLIEDHGMIESFYEGIGLYARANGINISVISIIGTECKIENLGHLAELTSGIVDRVDPLNIAKNFQSIMSLPVLATQVSATLIVHKGLYIRGENDTESEKNFEVHEYGNVTKDSIITFEYGVRKLYNKEEFSSLSALPFQLQIRYTRLDGMKCMRVISKQQPLTFDRNEAEEAANVAVIGVHSVRHVADIASKGRYLEARMENLSRNRFLSRVSRTEHQKRNFQAWSSHTRRFETELSNVQRREAEQGEEFSEDDSDKEEDDDEDDDNERKKERAVLMQRSRKSSRNDTTSTMLYQFKHTNYSNLE